MPRLLEISHVLSPEPISLVCRRCPSETQPGSTAPISPRGLPGGAKPSSPGRPVQQDQNLRAEARNGGMLPASPPAGAPRLSWHPHQPLCSDPVSLLLSTGGARRGPALRCPWLCHPFCPQPGPLPPAPAQPYLLGAPRRGPGPSASVSGLRTGLAGAGC